LSGDIVHVKKYGLFDVDEVLKSLFVRDGELSDGICNLFVPEVKMKFTVEKSVGERPTNIPWKGKSEI
jgi:hypothetical protein